MSDTPLDLPARPSLEQLRKQARERLLPGGKLTGAQFALARAYGFESWPKLARHVEALARPEVAQQDAIARDMAAVHHRADEAAAARLNDLFHSALDVEQIRNFLRDRLFHLPDGAERIARFDAGDARLLVARLFGFDDWDALIVAGTEAAREAAGLSTTPPFHRIDPARRSLSIQQPMSRRDWDRVMGIMRERGLVELEANNMMDDAAMATLADVMPHLKVLKIHGSDRVTDEGLRHLSRLADLEHVELGGWKSPMTDAGLSALRGLPRLRILRSVWSRRITAAGVRAALTPCPALEDVNFMGAPVGDGVIEAVAGKPHVTRVFAGDGVTDAALPFLHACPRFAGWHGGELQYGLMEFDAGPTYLGLRGAFSPHGLRALERLRGLFALKLEWKPGTLPSTVIGQLAPMDHLGFLAIEGDTCDDEAMRQIGSLPHLRMLLAQEPIAGDVGFAHLSRSATLEYYWGRECPNLTGRGLAALAAMPALKGLAVSCKQVDDEGLSALTRFPALRSLMPMDVSDEGFRHVGRCERLEELWCMYCQNTGDAATDHVRGLKLKTYYAGYTKISDRSLEILSRMTTLERIELEGCHWLTDAGVRKLARLPSLRALRVAGCRNVTREGANGFAPQVHVNYSTV